MFYVNDEFVIIAYFNACEVAIANNLPHSLGKYLPNICESLLANKKL